ncbi:MAG: cell wall-binding repeat-containing protein [Euzebya sp.]
MGGPSRVETAVLGSQARGSADSVVLSRADLFADAQIGTGFAVLKDAPILLTQPGTLHPATEAEILRLLDPGDTVYIVGGTEAVSEAVQSRLSELGFVVVRFDGANRFDTAALVAVDGLGTPDTYLLADGNSFHDTIVAGAASIVADADPGQVAAVLLSDIDQVPAETQAVLDAAGGAATVVTIGSDAADALPAVEHVVGPTPAALSVRVAERFFTDPVAVGVATDADFADALTGSSVIGSPRVGPGPMLFTDPASLTAVTRTYLESIRRSLQRSFVFGGTDALSAAVHEEIRQALLAE